MTHEGVSSTMLCAEPLKEELLGASIANESDANYDVDVPHEHNHPHLIIGSQFRHEGNDYYIVNVDFNAGEMSSNNHNDNSNDDFANVQVINKMIEKTVNPDLDQFNARLMCKKTQFK